LSPLAIHVSGWLILKRYSPLKPLIPILIEDLPEMRPTMFLFIWLSGCREGDILVIDQPETRIVYGGHFCEPIRMKWAIFIEDLP
jgi:hypothetical protein